jgi:Flp pilus assembly protein TadD
MASGPKLYRILRYVFSNRFLSTVALALLLPVAVWPQSGGSASTGTGGRHIIAGKIFFPSGRSFDRSIPVKLQSFMAGEISALSDQSGSFTFGSLAPGNYTVLVNAGENYEVARENVTIDSDLDLGRQGMPAPQMSRRYTVMITLQPTREVENRAKASVINAALAEVPEAARSLYQTALELGQTGNSLKAIDDLRAAISLYPKFALALNELGVQYLKLGQANKAVEPLWSASQLTPDGFTPKLNLGVALLETQKLTEAETQLREALKISSTPTAHMYLGLTLARLHIDTEAERELKSAIELGGNQLAVAQSHYYLGGLYWRKRDYRRAADELETYLRLAPNAPGAERVRVTIKELRAKS